MKVEVFGAVADDVGAEEVFENLLTVLSKGRCAPGTGVGALFRNVGGCC